MVKVGLVTRSSTPRARAMPDTKAVLPAPRLLKNTGLTLDGMDVVAVAAGPGSFTGVRIAADVEQLVGAAQPVHVKVKQG